MTTEISNPILKGFNPDPSICRDGDDYYIATSTFEWFPGVQVHHSRDLRNWRLVARPLNRASLLDMRGVPDSCGVWAPCLSHADGKFWLVYTRVHRFDGSFKDTHNFLTCCAGIDGIWSEPVYLDSRGFDPSLFHDDDGRKWYLSMIWDHRPERSSFGGIYLQEYCEEQQCLTGPGRNIFPGSELGITEGPHLYRRNGYYYLLTAEGGTGYHHAMTMARSRAIDGPYEPDPAGHFVTAAASPASPLQRCGHGDWVETQNGECYAVHLCSRPLSPDNRRSPLGRESAIQRVVWDENGWLRLENGGQTPEALVQSAALDEHVWPATPHRRDFDSDTLPEEFQWLRTPQPETLFSLRARPGYLRLFGRESLGSLYTSSLVARRQQAISFVATTCLEFSPQHFQQMAGLVCYYNSHKFHYLYVSRDEILGRYLGVTSCLADQLLAADFPLQGSLVDIPESGTVFLRAEVDGASLRFGWSTDGRQWQQLPVTLDQSLLSDEAGKGEGANFTGAFVGMCCQDTAGTGLAADFNYFDYVERT